MSDAANKKSRSTGSKRNWRRKIERGGIEKEVKTMTEGDHEVTTSAY